MQQLKAVDNLYLTTLDPNLFFWVVPLITISSFLFAVKPQSVEVRTGDGQVLADGAVLGPLLERTRVNVSCLVREGKPQPKVAWYFNGKEMLDGESNLIIYCLLISDRNKSCGSY